MKKVIIIFSCFLAFSCHNSNPESLSSLGSTSISGKILEEDEEIEIEPPRTAQPSAPPSNVYEGLKIIRTGNMNFEVDDITQSKHVIDSLLNESGSYYENEQYGDNSYRKTYTLKLRIPNTNFEALVYGLEQGVGRITLKSIKAQDVTEEFVDIKIRLENKLATMKQYQTILQKAKTIEEILQVQERIRRIEEEIDRKKGRLRYLNDRIAYSTLNIEISEPIKDALAGVPSYTQELGNAFNNGIQGVMGFVLLIVNIWPIWILVLVIFLSRNIIVSKIRNRS